MCRVPPAPPTECLPARPARSHELTSRVFYAWACRESAHAFITFTKATWRMHMPRTEQLNLPFVYQHAIEPQSSSNSTFFRRGATDKILYACPRGIHPPAANLETDRWVVARVSNGHARSSRFLGEQGRMVRRHVDRLAQHLSPLTNSVGFCLPLTLPVGSCRPSGLPDHCGSADRRVRRSG